jgi:uncharacterized lipoprotein
MKKIVLAIATIALLSACKKDWTCECTNNGDVTTRTIKSATKRQAKANCVSTKVTVLGFTDETKCTLK